MPAVKPEVAVSEIARVSRSRMIWIACGSQHTVVSTAPRAPMASMRVIAAASIEDLLRRYDSSVHVETHRHRQVDLRARHRGGRRRKRLGAVHQIERLLIERAGARAFGNACRRHLAQPVEAEGKLR